MASTSVDTRPVTGQDHDNLPQNRAQKEHPSERFLNPSSSTSGFFQSPPHVLNQMFDDVALRRALELFLPSTVRQSITPELSSFGDRVLSRQVLHWVADAEKNPPYLRTWDSWGKRVDELVTSEGWRNLQDLGIKEGMASIGHENQYREYSRVYHFAKYHLWCGSAAWVNCPSLMTDGTISLLRKHLSDPSLPPQQRLILESACSRLTSRDPAFAWVTGQWMTERAGGSDVSQTETLATHSPDMSAGGKACGTDGMPLGPWVIDGFKWFSSATDCFMTIFLARTSKGVSLFYAPMRRTLASGPNSMGYETELNGIRIQRELEIKGLRAYLIGEEGRGTKEIATVLNIARIHNAVTSMGLWGRGLGVSRAFALCREVGLKPLYTKTAYVRTLARMHVEYRAHMMLTFFVSTLLGVVEQSQHNATSKEKIIRDKTEPMPIIPSSNNAEHLLRLLTPVVKGLTAKKAIAGLSECMESLGGVGYLENEDMQYNIARLYRDAGICAIWEGTTDMMAHDVLRVLYGKTRSEVMSAINLWIYGILGPEVAMPEQKTAVEGWWDYLKNILETKEKGEVEMRAREVMELLGDVVMGVLVIGDARRDGGKIATDVAKMWTAKAQASTGAGAQDERWQDQAARDLRIVFETEHMETPKARL